MCLSVCIYIYIYVCIYVCMSMYGDVFSGWPVLKHICFLVLLSAGHAIQLSMGTVTVQFDVICLGARSFAKLVMPNVKPYVLALSSLALFWSIGYVV